MVQARLENIRLSTSIAKKEALIRKKVKEACSECCLVQSEEGEKCTIVEKWR